MVLRQFFVSVDAIFVAINVQASSTQALSMKECSAKYKAAKEAGTPGGTKWNEFSQGAMWRGGEGRADAFIGPAAFSGPTGEIDCRSRAGGQRGICHYLLAQKLW